MDKRVLASMEQYLAAEYPYPAIKREWQKGNPQPPAQDQAEMKKLFSDAHGKMASVYQSFYQILTKADPQVKTQVQQNFLVPVQQLMVEWGNLFNKTFGGR